MRITYLQRSLRDPSVAEAVDATALGIDELLATADVLSHAPLTAETRHLVDATALQRMKPSAILLNTARGPLVDERALAEALRDSEIAGAGLDVYEHELAVDPLLLGRHAGLPLPHVAVPPNAPAGACALSPPATLLRC